MQQTLHPDSLLQGGKYRIIEMLGQGGFGITYLGEQANLGRKVAVKEFFMEKLCNRDEETSQVSVGSEGSREMVDRFREKFIKEACRIANLRHRNIVSVIDIFEENGTAYYVMAYCSGGSLSVMMRQQYPDGMPEKRALKYIRQVASALDYIHKNRMNHLDVKPGNIMLNEEDDAILIDFGLAKQYDSATGQQTSSTPVGVSEGYAPMEQYKLGGVGTFSPSTDIYSLGATLYKLVTGQTPPSALDIDEVDLSDFPLSPSVKRAIRAAMGHRRTDRPQSIEAWLSLLNDDVETVNEESVSLEQEPKPGMSPESESDTIIPAPNTASSIKPTPEPEAPAPSTQTAKSRFQWISSGVKARHTSCNVLLGIIFVPLVFFASAGFFMAIGQLNYISVLCLLAVIASYSLVLQNRKGGLWLGIITVFTLIAELLVEEYCYEQVQSMANSIDPVEMVFSSMMASVFYIVIFIAPIMLTLLIRKNGVSALKNLERKGVFFELRYEIMAEVILCIISIVIQVFQQMH